MVDICDAVNRCVELLLARHSDGEMARVLRIGPQPAEVAVAHPGETASVQRVVQRKLELPLLGRDLGGEHPGLGAVGIVRGDVGEEEWAFGLEYFATDQLEEGAGEGPPPRRVDQRDVVQDLCGRLSHALTLRSATAVSPPRLGMTRCTSSPRSCPDRGDASTVGDGRPGEIASLIA